MKSNEVTVSIVTVVFNGEKYLEQTIQSVLNQTYSNIEYIIIDGGSTDGTVDIIKKYEHKLAYWVSEKDNGIYNAMNKGITHCNGELIGIINADDWYESNAIELVVNAYSEEQFDICHGNLNLIDLNSNIFIKATDDLKDMKKRMMIFHPTVFIKKSIYLTHGMYDESFNIAADYDLILRLYTKKMKFLRISKLITNFREGGISSNFTYVNLRENIKVRSKNKVRSIIFKEFLIYFYFRFKSLK